MSVGRTMWGRGLDGNSLAPGECGPRWYKSGAPGRSLVSPGFTLLELMVVLAIAAVLLTITPPLITAAIPGIELKSSARRVMSGLRLAREVAIRNGRDIAFTLDVEARTFAVDGGFRNGRLPEDLELKLEAAETEMLNDHTGAIRFYPDGSSTGGRIILALEDRGYQVGVQWLTGRVLMASWEAE